MRRISLLFITSLFIDGVFCAKKTVPVTVGDSVTLHTEKQRETMINWIFKGISIVMVNEKTKYYPNEKFNGRLKLNPQTGDLTITNITSEHTGEYQLEIIINGILTTETFSIVVSGDADEVKLVSVMEGDSLTLHPDVTDIRNYDMIQWTFQQENFPLAELNRKTSASHIYDDYNVKFSGRLKLNEQTGDLTIRNIKIKHTGLYEVNITSTTHTIHQSFPVTVSVKTDEAQSVNNGGSLTLHTYTELQKADLIEWLFLPDDSLIAKIYKPASTVTTYDGDDERFRHKLKLDDQTGSLTIKEIRKDHTGLYEVTIRRKRRSIKKRLIVIVSGLSSGVMALIYAGGVLLFIAAVSVVMYIRNKNLQKMQTNGSQNTSEDQCSYD